MNGCGAEQENYVVAKAADQYQGDALAQFEDKKPPASSSMFDSLPACCCSIPSSSQGECHRLLSGACSSSCGYEGTQKVPFGLGRDDDGDTIGQKASLSLHDSRELSLRARAGSEANDRCEEILKRMSLGCSLPVESCGFSSCWAEAPAEAKYQGDDALADSRARSAPISDPSAPIATKSFFTGQKTTQAADIALKCRRGEWENVKLMLDGVHYSNPRIDKVHWLQFLGQVIWPYVQKAVTKYIVNDLSASIRANCADIPMMRDFTFAQCDFGPKLPIFDPLTTRNKDNGCELDLTLDWKCAESNVEVDLGGWKAGMKDIRIQCSVLLLFCPLLGSLPITGGLSICFPNPPELDFEWTGVGRAFPAAKAKSVILKAISDAIVVPNRVFVNIAESSGLVEDDELPQATTYQTPPPLGVMRVEVVAARSLPPLDLNGRSDPYCRVRLGSTEEFRTKTIFKTLEPTWSFGEGIDFLIWHPQQQVKVTVYDEDKLGKDDAIGTAYVEKNNIISEGHGDADHEESAASRRFPTVAEVIDNPNAWWPLDIGAMGHNEDKFLSEVKLKVMFARADKQLYDVHPNYINCPKKCGLVEDTGRSSKACAYCSRTISQSWMERLSSAKRPKGKVCTKCKFGVCHACWVEKRPACGILRIVIKSAHVPPQHAQQTAVVSFEFEGETVRTGPSKVPFDLATPWTSKPDAVNNLHWHAGLTLETVGRCLGVPLDEAKHLLNKSAPETAPTLPKSLKDMQGRHTVIFDEAFHFLVRDPGVDDAQVKIVYKSGASNALSDKVLGKNKGHTLTATLQMADLAKRCSQLNKTPSYWLHRLDAKDIECRVTSADKNDKGLEAVLYLEVRFEPLTANLLDAPPSAASGAASSNGSSEKKEKKKRRQSEVLFSGEQSVW